MTYRAKIIADSISPCGVRLTTMEVCFPRFVLAEFNTHRMFSRNSASSRAIPVPVRVAQVKANPFIPEEIGMNQRGMAAEKQLDPEKARLARDIWIEATNAMVTYAQALAAIEVHKQLANRLTEFCSWHTAVVTATEWDNYFALRISKHAQPEIRIVSELMKIALEQSTPTLKKPGEWHLPYVGATGGAPEDAALTVAEKIQVSAARCARVSYLTQDGRRDPSADFELHDKLRGNGHMSPLEHPATCLDKSVTDKEFYGNFRAPWFQYRKMVPNEAVFVTPTIKVD